MSNGLTWAYEQMEEEAKLKKLEEEMISRSKFGHRPFSDEATYTEVLEIDNLYSRIADLEAQVEEAKLKLPMLTQVQTLKGSLLKLTRDELIEMVEALTPKPTVVVERWFNVLMHPTLGSYIDIYSTAAFAHEATYSFKTEVLARAIPFRWEKP